MSVKTRIKYHRETNAPLPRERIKPAVAESQPVRSHSVGRSVRFAWDGVFHAVRTQRNFRIQLACGAIATCAGIACRIDRMEWVMVAAMIAMVLSLELVNSAMEAVVDMITIDYHPLAKVAKDCAAAAVLVASGLAVVIAVFIFMPHVQRMIQK